MKCLYSYSLLGKTGSVFGKNSVRFWEKNSVFGKNRLRFWKKLAPLLGQSGSVLVQNWLGVWIGLGQSSSLTSLGLDFRGLGLGVSKTSQPVASWKGKMLKPINFDAEPVLC